MAENNLNKARIVHVPSKLGKTYAEMLSYSEPPVEKFKDLRPIVKQKEKKSRNVGKVSWWNDAFAAGQGNPARGQEIGIAPGQEIVENAALGGQGMVENAAQEIGIAAVTGQGNDYPKDDLAP